MEPGPSATDVAGQPSSSTRSRTRPSALDFLNHSIPILSHFSSELLGRRDRSDALGSNCLRDTPRAFDKLRQGHDTATREVLDLRKALAEKEQDFRRLEGVAHAQDERIKGLHRTRHDEQRGFENRLRDMESATRKLTLDLEEARRTHTLKMTTLESIAGIVEGKCAALVAENAALKAVEETSRLENCRLQRNLQAREDELRHAAAAHNSSSHPSTLEELVSLSAAGAIQKPTRVHHEGFNLPLTPAMTEVSPNPDVQDEVRHGVGTIGATQVSFPSITVALSPMDLSVQRTTLADESDEAVERGHHSDRCILGRAFPLQWYNDSSDSLPATHVLRIIASTPISRHPTHSAYSQHGPLALLPSDATTLIDGVISTGNSSSMSVVAPCSGLSLDHHGESSSGKSTLTDPTASYNISSPTTKTGQPGQVLKFVHQREQAQVLDPFTWSSDAISHSLFFHRNRRYLHRVSLRRNLVNAPIRGLLERRLQN